MRLARRPGRSRTLVAALALASAPAASSPQAPPTPQPAAAAQTPAGATPAFPTRVELVTVDVVAVDKAGRAVAGLGQSNFTVSEDGVPQTVTSFQAVVVPPAAAVGRAPVARPRVSTNVGPELQPTRTFLLFFDDIHLSPGLSVAAKAAVGEFLRTGVRDGDRVSLLAASGAVWWSARMPQDKDELVAILKRLDGRLIAESSPDRVTEYEAMRIVEYDDPDVGYQVQRRFDAYGTAGRKQSGDRQYRDTTDRTSVVGLIDPYVRSRAVDVHRQATERRRITMRMMTKKYSLHSKKGKLLTSMISLATNISLSHHHVSQRQASSKHSKNMTLAAHQPTPLFYRHYANASMSRWITNDSNPLMWVVSLTDS